MFFLIPGTEQRTCCLERRDQTHQERSSSSRECEARPRQVQDPARDPKGQHQTKSGPVREHVIGIALGVSENSGKENVCKGA